MEHSTFSEHTEGERHEGEKYLELLGIGHLADHEISGYGIKMRDFLDICGDHARPLLIGLESLDRDDPRFAPTQAALSGYISKFIGSSEG